MSDFIPSQNRNHHSSFSYTELNYGYACSQIIFSACLIQLVDFGFDRLCVIHKFYLLAVILTLMRWNHLLLMLKLLFGLLLFLRVDLTTRLWVNLIARPFGYMLLYCFCLHLFFLTTDRRRRGTSNDRKLNNASTRFIRKIEAYRMD